MRKLVMLFMALCIVSSMANAVERTFELGNSGVFTTMVWVEPGQYQMGALGTDADAEDHEYPRHDVTISNDSNGIWIGKYEVTQSEWEAIMGDWDFLNDDNPQHPAETISWDEIVSSFLPAVNTDPEIPFRLPTEAEWEFACRGGVDDTRFWWGDDPDYSELGEYAWYVSNSEGHTHPVGQKQPNPYGLYDVLGNVIEWCSDWFGLYPDYPVEDPQGPLNGDDKIQRGGSWNSPQSSNRPSWRTYNPSASSGSDGNFGLRLVCDAPRYDLIELTLAATDPLQVVAGTNFAYGTTLVSHLPSIDFVDIWTEAILPNGNPYGPIWQINNLPFTSNTEIVISELSQAVPLFAPGGSYQFVMKAGYFNYFIMGQDSFEFTVDPGAGVQFGYTSDWVSEGHEEAFRSALAGVSNDQLPSDFSIGSAYPNPFNPSTSFEIQLPAAADLSVVVYNVAGQQVAEVANGVYPAGSHTLTFDASNLASGVYFVHATVPHHADHVQKVMLAR